MKKIIVSFVLIVSIMSIYGNIDKDISRLTVQLESGITSLDDEPVISIGGSLIYGLTPWLHVGIGGSLFHTLERSYEDSLGRKYQAESATTEQFLQPYWKVNDVWALGIKLGTGIQLVQFRYEESFRDDIVWTEEVLDKLVIPSMTTSVTLEYSFCPLHTLQLEIGNRYIKKTFSDFSEQDYLEGSLFGKIQYGFRW